MPERLLTRAGSSGSTIIGEPDDCAPTPGKAVPPLCSMVTTGVEQPKLATIFRGFFRILVHHNSLFPNQFRNKKQPHASRVSDSGLTESPDCYFRSFDKSTWFSRMSVGIRAEAFSKNSQNALSAFPRSQSRFVSCSSYHTVDRKRACSR